MPTIIESLKEFCNDYAEKHAFMHGFYDGFTRMRGLSERTKNDHEVKKEYHYAELGFLLGYISKILLILGFGYLGKESIII